MKLTSSAFEMNGKIPSRYSCDGENINPELIIKDVPENTESLVLIMDDPDIPESVKEQRGIQVFDHWIVFNILKETRKIEEGKNPDGVLGNNSKGELGYTGPCPPDKEHRYFFKLYALDKKLDLKEGATKKEIIEAMQDNIIDHSELIGRYERKN